MVEHNMIGQSGPRSRIQFASARSVEEDIPLRVKRGMAEKLFAIPRFQNVATEDLIYAAQEKFAGKKARRGIHISDRATAIALLMGTAGCEEDKDAKNGTDVKHFSLPGENYIVDSWRKIAIALKCPEKSSACPPDRSGNGTVPRGVFLPLCWQTVHRGLGMSSTASGGRFTYAEEPQTDTW